MERVGIEPTSGAVARHRRNQTSPDLAKLPIEFIRRWPDLTTGDHGSFAR